MIAALRRLQDQWKGPRPSRRRWKAQGGSTPVEALELRMLPSALMLVNDTGTPNDNITTDARITNDGTAPSGGMVYLDVNGDGSADFQTTADQYGTFVADLNSQLNYGTVTVHAWSELWQGAENPVVVVDLGQLTFTYEPPPNNPPVISNFAGVQGTNHDWVFTGTVQDEYAPGLTVTFGGILDGYYATVDANGRFSLVVHIEPGGGGIATAQTVDDMCQASNLARDMIFA